MISLFHTKGTCPIIPHGGRFDPMPGLQGIRSRDRSRSIGGILFFALLLLLLSTGGVRSIERSNVLFIVIDDLNGYVSCLGDPNAKTPHLDRLAKRGVLFTNAHCQAPICGPSRASLMTGLLPSTTGIYGQIKDTQIKHASKAAREATLLPDFLENHGYATYGCGKLFHNGDRARVFDEFGHGTNFGPKPAKRFAYDPDWFETRIGRTQTDWGVFPETDEKMPDHQTADWILAKLEALSKEPKTKPFFLAAGFCRPHVPWYVPQKWFDRHPLADLKMPPYKVDDWDDLPNISKRVNAAPAMPPMDWVLENKHWPSILQAYLASTTFADHQVGKLLDALDASPFAKNTFIILWTDHGYHVGEKGRFAKQSLWKQASRVPLIIAGPEIESDRRANAPVQLLDLYPTLADLLGLPPNPENEGHSLRPLIENTESSWGHPAITTYGPGNHAIQTATHRYIHYEDGSAELYDHRVDPNEWENIASAPSSDGMIEQLKALLPKTNVPNAKHSSYDFNDYFIEVLR